MSNLTVKSADLSAVYTIIVTSEDENIQGALIYPSKFSQHLRLEPSSAWEVNICAGASHSIEVSIDGEAAFYSGQDAQFQKVIIAVGSTSEYVVGIGRGA